jgi:DNA-binding NarL/FixJ family response regulator
VRVVIAEDLALLRDGLARLLRDNGFEVVAAVEDGASLLRAVQDERPEIAIVDIRLPPTFRDEGCVRHSTCESVLRRRRS